MTLPWMSQLRSNYLKTILLDPLFLPIVFPRVKQNWASIHLSSEKHGQIVLYPKGLNRGEL